MFFLNINILYTPARCTFAEIPRDLRETATKSYEYNFAHILLCVMSCSTQNNNHYIICILLQTTYAIMRLSFRTLSNYVEVKTLKFRQICVYR